MSDLLGDALTYELILQKVGNIVYNDCTGECPVDNSGSRNHSSGGDCVHCSNFRPLGIQVRHHQKGPLVAWYNE